MKNCNRNSVTNFGRSQTVCAAICRQAILCILLWDSFSINNLSEKIETYANSALEDDEVTFKELWEMTDSDAAELQEEVKNQCLENIGYFIEPKFLFSSVIENYQAERKYPSDAGTLIETH